jgi:hypothetical protein
MADISSHWVEWFAQTRAEMAYLPEPETRGVGKGSYVKTSRACQRMLATKPFQLVAAESLDELRGRVWPIGPWTSHLA